MRDLRKLPQLDPALSASVHPAVWIARIKTFAVREDCVARLTWSRRRCDDLVVTREVVAVRLSVGDLVIGRRGRIFSQVNLNKRKLSLAVIHHAPFPESSVP